MQTLKFPLVPPVIIRRGNKELQYVPQVLDPSISGAFLLSELLKNDNQVLELDSEKLEAASQLVGEGQFVAILWSPAKKDSLGDVIFDGPGSTKPGPGKRYVQLLQQEPSADIVTPGGAQNGVTVN